MGSPFDRFEKFLVSEVASHSIKSFVSGFSFGSFLFGSEVERFDGEVLFAGFDPRDNFLGGEEDVGVTLVCFCKHDAGKENPELCNRISVAIDFDGG